MSALLWAAAVWLTPGALIFAWIRADRWLDGRWADETPEVLETTPEWLAILAATEPTPIYDALVCEQIEKAEGWVS